MRFAAIVVVLVAGLMTTALAQRPQKPKGKPSHSEERESNKKTPRIGKDATHDHTSAAQELRRVEQSSRKVAPTRKSESANAPRNNPGLKAEKRDGNTPIRFAAKGGAGKSSGKSGDALKGRLRHKGRR